MKRRAIPVLPAVFAWTMPGCGGYIGANAPGPGEPASPESASEELQSSLAESHEKNCGLYPAIAGYTFAGFVAWHRIDSGKHDLSDVVFGAALGYTVGAAVGEKHAEVPLLQAHWAPTAGLTRTAPGLSLEWRF